MVRITHVASPFHPTSSASKQSCSFFTFRERDIKRKSSFLQAFNICREPIGEMILTSQAALSNCVISASRCFSLALPFNAPFLVYWLRAQVRSQIKSLFKAGSVTWPWASKCPKSLSLSGLFTELQLITLLL